MYYDFMPKLKLVLTVLLVIIVTSLLVVFYDLNDGKASNSEIKEAYDGATNLYRQMKSRKVDLSSGPCLSNDLMPGWVADLVHDPRIALDELPENQCQAYFEGRAKHFVELDLQGRLVRAK